MQICAQCDIKDAMYYCESYVLGTPEQVTFGTCCTTSRLVKLKWKGAAKMCTYLVLIIAAHLFSSFTPLFYWPGGSAA